MRKASRQEKARALVLNALALRVSARVEGLALALATEALGWADESPAGRHDRELMALEAVELAASWARSYQASPAGRAAAAAKAVRLGEAAQAPGAALARE